MAKKHEIYLNSLFLNKELILTSSELCNEICEIFPDCTRSNARKIIEIAVSKSLIQSSKPITFGNNQYAYYGKTASRDSVIRLLETFGNSLSRIKNKISSNGGIISYSELIKISSCTIEKTSTKVKSLKEIVGFLQREDVLNLEKGSYKGVNYLISKKILEGDRIGVIQNHISMMNVDVLLIKPIINFLKNINLIDDREIIRFRNINTLDILPQLNNLGWDAYAYTYTTGFYDYVGDKNLKKSTLAVLDFKLSSGYTLFDLHGFYNRIQIYRNSVKNRKHLRNIIPIIFVNHIHTDALVEAKKLNFIILRAEDLYGDKFDELVEQLIPLYSYKFNSISFEDKETILNNIDSVLEFINNSGHTVSFGNMKGDLFELLMNPVISSFYKKEDAVRRSYFIDSYQYDFVIQTKYEIIVVEVKGYKKDKKIPLGYYDEAKKKPQKESVKWFFNYTLGIFRDKFMGGQKSHGIPIKACYITTSKFDDDAIEYLKKLNAGNLKPSNLDLYYDGETLIDLLKKNDFKDEIKIIENYFK